MLMYTKGPEMSSRNNSDGIYHTNYLPICFRPYGLVQKTTFFTQEMVKFEH